LEQADGADIKAGTIVYLPDSSEAIIAPITGSGPVNLAFTESEKF
jgi:hypothetical protein